MNTIKTPNPITYSLRVEKKNSDFYSELDEYRSKLVKQAKIEYFGAVSTYQNYVKENKIEKQRHWDEYFLELLMLGIFWNVYSPFISSRTKYYKFLFDGLYFIRTNSKRAKSYADKTRGYLATLLLRKEKKTIPDFELKYLKQLILWMDCTKEFTEEVKRLKNWMQFLELNPETFNQLQLTIRDFTENFKRESGKLFGQYTQHVESFLAEKHVSYKYQENYFFTGRREVEYHLNMVGASILNHVLKEEFDRTKNKVVLLPKCMSVGKSCKARKNGYELHCTHCNENCNVSKLTKDLSKEGMKTVLIPHSSKFSQYLQLWANQKETGLIGVACVLNLIRGGYELIDLKIPSQCVFLDYCGCKKHWNKGGGIPTNLNLEQLKKILNVENGDVNMVNS